MTPAGCETPRSPFDELRANGSSIETIGDFPFVLSLSKHENHFFSSLLDLNCVSEVQSTQLDTGTAHRV